MFRKMKEWEWRQKKERNKEEEKQRQYDEMIELRRQQRKIQSKGADCTNLKEYQQEVIKSEIFADNHGNTYYGTAYLDRAVC